MRRPVLTIIILVLLLLVSSSAWLLTTEDGNQRLLSWTLGDKLQIKSYQGSLLEGLSLTGISYSDAQLQLTVESLQLHWRPVALFSGLLHIEELKASGIHYTSLGPTQETEIASAPLSLPVAVRLDSMEFTGIKITTGTDVQKIARIALQAKTAEKQITFSKVQLNYADYSASGEGQLELAKDYPFQFNLQWQGEVPELGQASGKGEIKGDINSLTIDHTTQTPFKLSTRGEITLTGPAPSIKLEGDWQQLQWPLQAAKLKSSTGQYQLNGPLSNPQLQNEAVLYFPATNIPPVILKIKSQLSANGLEDLSLTILEQRDGTGPAMSLNVTGAIKLLDSGPELDLKGDWSAARWPLLTEPLTQSPSGQFTLQGPVQQLLLDTMSTLQFPQKHAPNMEARLQGTLSPTGLNAITLEADLLGGNSRVTGQVAWEPTLSWNLSVNGESLDPAQQWPEWPGKLALTADIKGGENEQGLWLDADLKSLAGTLQQQPLQASGQGHYDQAGLQLQDLKLNSGPNQLSANGTVGDTLNLSYQLNAPDLSAFWPALKGAIAAKGDLTGTPTTPEVNSSLKASGLHYGEQGIEQLEGQLIWKKDKASVQLAGKGLRSGEWSGRSLSLNINGRPDDHRAVLALDSQELKLNTRLTGGWQTNHWQGDLSEFAITQPQLGRWTATAPAKLLVGAEEIKLTEICLSQDDARLCAKGDWTPANSHFAGNLSALPLTRILHWLPPEVSVEGAIDGRFQLEGPLTGLKGEAQLSLNQGALLLESAEEQPVRLALQDGLLSLEMTPKENRVELRLKAGEGDVALIANTGPLSTNKPIALSGKLDAQIPDLKPLGLLVPGLSEIRGKLVAEATLGGHLRQPEIQGFMQLTEGSANLPQLGLELKAIQLSARNQGTERLLLEGEIKSGDGPLRLNGDLLLNAEQGWPLSLKLQGENFQVVRLPEAVAYATPELEIALKKNLLTLKGKLLLPKASIELRELPQSAVSLSDDEIIVGRTEQTAKPSPLAIDAEISVEVGDQVQFNGFGLDTRLEGKVDLRSKQGRNQAQGELTLKEGRYKAYGQDLTIDQGRLLFNGPPENPSLDIKATRLSLDRSVTAIVKLTGNLRTPQVQVSSTPTLPEEEALSYLITGQGLSAEGPGKAALLRQAVATKGLEKSQEILDRIATGLGVDEVRIQEGSSLEDTALLLGKYLSPDLYVSYAVGLFDNQGALITRYRLSERLRLEVQSGKGQSMDLIYDVER